MKYFISYINLTVLLSYLIVGYVLIFQEQNIFQNYRYRLRIGHSKMESMRKYRSKNATTVFIAWFPETLQQLEAYFGAHSTIKPTTLLYRNANSFNTKDKTSFS